MPIATTTFHTPVGEFIAGATDDGICLFDFRFRKMLPAIQQRIAAGLNDIFEEGTHPLFGALRSELDEYFAGARKSFSIPVNPVGSAFQKAVWNSLLQIPYAATVTYAQQAKVFGDEHAIRAIASANGMNSLAIIIPCHRVTGAGGALTGYSGGLAAKRWLLDHEAKHAGKTMQAALF